MSKSEYQIDRERTKKQKERFTHIVGWVVISVVMALGIFGLIWIDKL
jgi:hypothetical protein